MPLQDLTPQLRTRLSRVERAVGFFVGFAALLLLFGFICYLYHTAARKRWFVRKVPYYVYVRNASGLKVGDPVKMMGFDVGEISEVTPMPPEEWFVQNQYNVFVRFLIQPPNYGYIWTDSSVKIAAADFLGNRVLEVIKGQTGKATVLETNGTIVEILSENFQDTYVKYSPQDKGVWLMEVEESPAATEKLDQIIKSVEAALPPLTNQLAQVLANGAEAASNFNALVLSAQPIATHLAEITTQLTEFNGAMGRWLFSSNFNQSLETTFDSATWTLNAFDTNMAYVVDKLSVSLDNLANLTSNLNSQVHANTNILSQISEAVVHADQLMQGLKRHWLFRSAFREKTTNRPPTRPRPPGRRP
jgi:ABC-type transporter Mla subunit MlaD